MDHLQSIAIIKVWKARTDFRPWIDCHVFCMSVACIVIICSVVKVFMALEAGQTAIKVRGSGFYVVIDIGSTTGNGQQVQLIIL